MPPVQPGLANLARDLECEKEFDEVAAPARSSLRTWRSTRASIGEQRDLIERSFLAVLLPLAVFVALRPEPYSLVPNGLDPVFYTGYAINFDDILHAIDGSYYFVTRWPAYLPARFATDALGASLGRLILRWIVASAMLFSLWNLGRRSDWNRSTQVAIGVVALSSPMFVRAYTSDYPEWLFTSLGVILVCECLAVERRTRRSLFIGMLIAAMVISNPFAIGVAAPPTLYYVMRRPAGAASVMGRGALVLAGFGSVTLGGLAWFEWRYGFSPYSATFDFLQNRSLQRDPLKSPRLAWMVAFTWIYVPGVVLTTWATPAVRRWTNAVYGLAPAVAFLAIQYTFQILDQFVRDGNGLEISYYWIAIYPSLAIVTALMLGAIRWTWRSCGVFVLVWVGMIWVSAHSEVRLPVGWQLVALAVAAFAIATILVRTRHPAWLVAAVMLLALSLQSFAPDYDPSGYHKYNTEPRYDSVFFVGHSNGTRTLADLVWLEAVLETLPDDSELHFVTDSGGGVLSAMYGAHVTGHLLINTTEPQLDANAEASILEFSRTGPHLLALVGSAAWVDGAAKEVADLPVQFDQLLHEVHDGGNGSGVVVGMLDEMPLSSGSWTATELLSNTGAVAGSVRQGRAGEHVPGYLAFGPYVKTVPGPLRAHLTYRSHVPPSVTDGGFDVAIDGVAQQALELPGTAGVTGTAVIDFEGDSAGLTEFRVGWSGLGDFEVLSVRFEAAPD